MSGEYSPIHLIGREKQTWSALASRGFNQLLKYPERVEYLVQCLSPKLAFAGFLASSLPEFFASTKRANLYRWAGVQVGDRVRIHGSIRFYGNGPRMSSNLIIGDGTNIAPGFTVGCAEEKVIIGKDVGIGPFVTIFTSFHPDGREESRLTPEVKTKPVQIGNGAKLEAGVLVLAGAHIGPGTVVRARSLVTKDIPANVVASGHPARVTRVFPSEIDLEAT